MCACIFGISDTRNAGNFENKEIYYFFKLFVLTLSNNNSFNVINSMLINNKFNVINYK